MKFLVCHPNVEAAHHMHRRLMHIFPNADCSTPANLTDAYHIIEHDQPDCLIFASDFANNSDFEMLAALIRILGIRGIWWKTSDHSFPAQARTPFDVVPEDVSDDALEDCIRAIVDQPRSRREITPTAVESRNYDPRQINLIGASTGGVEALTQTLRHFSSSSPPTLIVQHTGARFAQSLTRLLDGVTRASVIAAEDGMRFAPGEIYLSPDADHHLCISPNGRFEMSLVASDLVSGHRPSVDVLFQSALPFARHVTAALLTGMGKDGASGLLALRNAGAHTIVQDKATSVVYGMPRVALEIGAAKQQLALCDIGPALVAPSRTRVRA